MPDATTRPVYLIAHIDIADRDRYSQYEAGFGPIMLRYGGEIVAFEESPDSLEGTPLAGRALVLRFPTRQQAMDWFNDPDYVALAVHRRAASTARFVSILDEFAMPEHR